MRESLATTAQYTLNASADAGGLLALRARSARASAGLPDININDLVTILRGPERCSKCRR